MRVDTDISRETRERVSAYADEQDIRMRRAYGDMIRAGLETIDESGNDGDEGDE